MFATPLRRRPLPLGLCAALALSALPALAHHTFVQKYDNAKVVKFSGTVASVSYQNPHIFFDVETGKGTWTVETEGIAAAKGRGLTANLLKTGAKVTVSGWPARDGTGALGLKTVTFAGGPSITMRSTAR